ncbi:hypothetical protein [Solimonas fluminis]|uniref:hypothetical protein n=1 Tax=Solimonas fluminis TaxID=2086571 RepID=UPI00105743F0|nr:hypothetical protein [Solimonas fluminis]
MLNRFDSLLRAAAWSLAFACPAVLAQAVEEQAAAVQGNPAPGYRLGQGIVLGDSGFTAGGYAVMAYDGTGGAPGDPDWRAGLDALSGFLWWDGGGRWQFFTEVELEDGFLATSDEITVDDAYLGLERFYFDYRYSDSLKLRLGKFLTPVGHWNLIHAAPLVWTTSRPLITEATFPVNATGAMLTGVLPWLPRGLEYSIYGSPGQELFPNPELDTFEEAYGLHLSTEILPQLSVGLSFVDFELDSSADQRRRLYGADFQWNWQRYELTGEFAYRITSLTNAERDEQGGYLQLAAPLGERLFAVARYETFRDTAATRDLNVYLGGLNYRPRPGLVFKAEYSRATDNDIDARDGLLASFAVLF